MSKDNLSKEIALRIALAARELPDTDVARLLSVLDDAIGLPPTLKSLAKLNVKILKSAKDGELSDIDQTSLKSAISVLKGETDIEWTDAPEVQDYAEGEMPESIRIACASNRGEELDGHFGSCQRFLIYQVDKNEIRLIEIRNASLFNGEGDKNSLRASTVDDCHVLIVASIGGPAAAKVVKAGIHPIKNPGGGKSREVLARIQTVLAGTPPPWLAKVMGQRDLERVRFQRAKIEASS